MPILGDDHCLPILHMSKRMVQIYTKDETIHQISIVYMNNHSLKFNNAFRAQVEKCLVGYFSFRTMKSIKNCLMKKNKSVMALIIIYENNG